MPSERATEIQAALIKQGYLAGQPTGTWDAQTVAAMEKLQADNGWQSKITPTRVRSSSWGWVQTRIQSSRTKRYQFHRARQG